MHCRGDGLLNYSPGWRAVIWSVEDELAIRQGRAQPRAWICLSAGSPGGGMVSGIDNWAPESERKPLVTLRNTRLRSGSRALRFVVYRSHCSLQTVTDLWCEDRVATVDGIHYPAQDMGKADFMCSRQIPRYIYSVVIYYLPTSNVGL